MGVCLNEYELLYIVSPRVPADDVPNAIESVNALVTGLGGEVLSTDSWGRRRLAYPIRQYFEGSYVFATVRMPPAGAAALEPALNLSEEVIRHLLTLGIIPPRQPRERRFEDRDRGFDRGDRGDRGFDGGDRDRGPEPDFAREVAAAAAPEAAPSQAAPEAATESAPEPEPVLASVGASASSDAATEEATVAGAAPAAPAAAE